MNNLSKVRSSELVPKLAHLLEWAPLGQSLADALFTANIYLTPLIYVHFGDL